MSDKDVKLAIQTAIKDFSNENPSHQAIRFFETLGYNTNRQDPFTTKTYASFKGSFLDNDSRFNEDKALTKEWKSIDLLFQLTTEEVSNQKGLFDTRRVDKTIIETYLFFVIELEKVEYTRTALAQITREMNKVFPMPVMLLFKHGEQLTLSVINRRLNKKDEQKDVLEKVTLIKDISTENPHRAHIEILFDLSFNELKRVHKITNFVELHNAWQKTLDTKELNKRFYSELSNWYFWAIHEVTFPGANEKADKHGLPGIKQEDKVIEHNSKNLIRMLTRLLFVWFIKEKNLIPEELFDETYLQENLINDIDSEKKDKIDTKTNGSKYYRAILQNLFFATLNQTVNKREFRKQGSHMNVTNLMRYESYFNNPTAFIELMENVVPFMNGGLFECLDNPDPLLKGKKGGDVIIYEDGFSDRKNNSLCVPDYIFFGKAEHVDLSAELDNKKQKDVTVNGLIDILKSYKFTVTENTPIEEDIALDPELLGRVFENLLASYNPETKITARKKTGSFYTPREIVNYMVDESLKAYLKQKMETDAGIKSEEAERRLDLLIGYNETYFQDENWFDDEQKKILIDAIDNCKIFDPACGSGAFPMGILHKLVHILHKLDPKNKLWKERQIKKANAIDDSDIRDNLIADIETAFNNNELDYGRKLYLIENCIYGVDIQPIATQISKLRFFISLIVDQKTDIDKDNFGIRPLPNLETKFVTANTLIGIEKPQNQERLFDNTNVQELEDKLKNVRHRLFSAKTPATKRKLRDEDQKLREEMGKLLVNAGWNNYTARQLAGWDPYNQNVSSLFFDPEWMFDIKDGFDVVIGNPPYGVSIKDSYRAKVVSHLGKVPDYEIYYYFIECALKLLKHNGIKSYIIPNTFLFNVFAKNYRIKLINMWNILCLLDCTAFKLFEGATVYNVITVFKKNDDGFDNIGYKQTKSAKSFIELLLRKNQYISKNILLENNKNWGLVFKLKPEILNIVQVIKGNSIVLESRFPGYSQGLIAYDKYKGQTNKIIESRAYHYKNQTKKGLKKWLWGEDITKYNVKWNGKEWIDYCKDIANPRKQYFFKRERILVREITNPSIFCAYTIEELYHDPAIICILNNEHNEIKSLLGILNSNLASFYHFNSSPKATKGAFPKILVEDIKTFPLKNTIPDEIGIISDYLIALPNDKSSFVFYFHLNDSLVYELYFPDEIKAADAEVLKHLTNLPAFKEDLDNENKMKTIEKVYQELSDPKHPVAIAIERQKTVREVLIIEGLDK